jgi:hypothetical protein
VRCVVMYARPGEETPQFYIVTGAYQERFFYDDNNQYVNGDEFKAKVEAMGFEVSRKLSLHQYRSVILNERQPTKEGVELRRLAAVHSLGPGPLYNLDQISAAMANEKISFRDVRNIVVERVSDMNTAANKNTSVKELKQNRESVVRWMEARNHLVDIMKQKPAAQKLSEGITSIRRIHLELCSLRVATNKALKHLEKEISDFQASQDAVNESAQQQAERLTEAINSCQKDLELKNRERGDLNNWVTQSQLQLRHFQDIGVEQLEILQDSEDSLKAQRIDRSRELESLQDVIGRVSSDIKSREAQIELNAVKQQGELSERQNVALNAHHTELQALHAAETDALGRLTTSERSGEIGKAQLAIARELGELQSKIEHPISSPASRESLQAAIKALDSANETYADTLSAKSVLEKAMIAARDASDRAVKRVNDAKEHCAVHSKRTADLQGKLTPASGSLLEFIRNGDSALWASASKLLDPTLLDRQDLFPVYVDSFPCNEGQAQIGAALVQVATIETPRWLGMTDVKSELESCTAIGRQLADAMQAAEVDATLCAKALRKATKEFQEAEAHASLALEALKNDRDTKNRLERFSKEEALRLQKDAQKTQASLNQQQDDLIAELNQLTQAFARSQMDVRELFAEKRKALDAGWSEKLKRFGSENDAILDRQRNELEAVKKDLNDQLMGLGVDPKRVNALNLAISDIQSKLDRITRNRHEVASWQSFKLETLPSLDIKRVELERCKVRCNEIASRKDTLEDELKEHIANVKAELADLAAAISSREGETSQLNNLLSRELVDFQDHVPAHLHVDWMVNSLRESVTTRKRSLDTEVDTLQKLTRTVRNVLIRIPGGPADWLEGKEKELPDRQILLEHQYLCAQAQVLCDWFDPSESGPYIDQINKEMFAFFHLAGEFVRVLDQFERSISIFNSKLQSALAATDQFARFRDLSVKVSSNLGQMGHLTVLRQMQDRSNRNSLSFRSAVLSERDLPQEEDAVLVRAFREVLEVDGSFRVNLHEQVRLECSLVEGGRLHTVTNEEEFRSISSNGNSALITAVVLMAFVQMIRGDSPVRLTWLVDEIGRFDGGNLSAFLHTLDKNRIDVISACPSPDPALARYFKRICLFNDDGAVFSSEIHSEEVEEVPQ